MNRKTWIKLAIDLVMMFIMLASMAYHITGNRVHEFLGISILALFIVHNILNRRWYRTILKTKYNARSALNTAVNFLLLVTMILLMLSSMQISRTVFSFIPVNDSLIARQMHVLSTYWLFILIPIHLAMHWEMIRGAAWKILGITALNSCYRFALHIMAVLISVYGVYAFFDREVGYKLILYYTYSYWNFDECAMFFFMDYICIMGAYFFVTYYLLKFVLERKKQCLSKNDL